MKLTEQQKKLLISGIFGLLLLFLVYRVYDGFFGGTTTVPPPTVVEVAPAKGASAGREVASPPGFAVKPGTAAKVGTTLGQLDPTLHMDAMQVTESLLYTGTGRNIFASRAEPPPVKLVKVVAPIAPPRPVQAYVPPVDSGPPPPPPINLKFFGTSTSASGVRRAFLLQGDEVYLAAAGDVVQRRYKVVSIAASSIVIEDLPNTNRQNLPLTPN